MTPKHTDKGDALTTFGMGIAEHAYEAGRQAGLEQAAEYHELLKEQCLALVKHVGGQAKRDRLYESKVHDVHAKAIRALPPTTKTNGERQ